MVRHYKLQPARLGFVALTLLAIQATASFGQTEGFISTRPDCVPGVQLDINYIQGPDPIVMDNGDLHVLVDAGECCGAGNWEGVFNLHYPATDQLETPRFFPLWAANDFGTVPSRNEHEAPFPSLFKREGDWHFVYTATFFPTNVSNRDRVGRVDLTDLYTRVGPQQVNNSWIEPIDSSCRPIGSCSDRGSGILATAVVDPEDRLYIYHPDGNYSSCSSGWVRHLIGANLVVLNPNSDDGCLTFSGLSDSPNVISDIALGEDEKFYLLSGHNADIKKVEEWVSDDGLAFSLSGQTYDAPAHPDPSFAYSVWDAGYMKNERRRIVEPRVVMSQISDGQTFSEIVDASLGRWELYYWAEAGAALPPNFGDDAHSCDTFAGFVDSIDCQTGVAGWAWDTEYPDYPISVDIFRDGVKVANIPADSFRQDLLNAGIGNGEHAFGRSLPAEFYDGAAHLLEVKFVRFDKVLGGGSQTVTCPASNFTVAVTLAGGGSGTVTSSPAGISCGSDCSGSFLSGTQVSLSATASQGSIFTGWTGDAVCADGTFTVLEATNCTASFELPLFFDGFEVGDTTEWSLTVGGQ